jgi:hypothetical protein
MKKLGILMAAAMLFVSAATFAAPAKAVKQDVKKEASAKKAGHKKHKKHHTAKAKSSTPAPKAK